MRKAHLVRVVFAASVVSGVSVWAACGGSDDKLVPPTDAGPDTSVQEPEDSGGGLDSGSNDDAASDAGADVRVYDAGPPIVLDGGDFEGGIPCVVGGALEDEPNDSTQLANELAPTRCGVIRLSPLDAGESDFLKFTLADASSEFFLQYSGEVSVLVETDGSAPVDITQGSPNLPFVKGQPYYVEVKSKTGKQQVWRVTLFQQ